MTNEDCFHLGAKALIHNADGKLLLLQKNSKKIQEDTKCLWDLPGGRIQKSESLEEALKREVFEETGLTSLAQISPLTTVLSPIRISLQDSNVGLILAVYLCSTLEDHPQIQLSEEHLSYIWVLPGEAAQLLAPNHPVELIEKITQLQITTLKEKTHEAKKV